MLYLYLELIYKGVLYLRFRSGVKDLEVMVQNVISSAFESLSRVEEGVEILDVFHHFSAREVSNIHLCTISVND